MISYSRVSLVAVAAAAAIVSVAGVANGTDFTARHSTQNDDGGYCGTSHYYDHFHGKNRRYPRGSFCNNHHGRTGYSSAIDDGPFGALTNGHNDERHPER